MSWCTVAAAAAEPPGMTCLDLADAVLQESTTVPPVLRYRSCRPSAQLPSTSTAATAGCDSATTRLVPYTAARTHAQRFVMSNRCWHNAAACSCCVSCSWEPRAAHQPTAHRPVGTHCLPSPCLTCASAAGCVLVWFGTGPAFAAGPDAAISPALLPCWRSDWLAMLSSKLLHACSACHHTTVACHHAQCSACPGA